MTKRILIDAVHPEEVRVAVADETRLLEFDFESVQKKQIKSNIYLGKITRVEPSLQAAFVEYGGNRQGFLPFSEIHFDYYQIPVEDKQKLKAMLEEDSQKEEEKIDKLEEQQAKKEESKKKGKGRKGKKDSAGKKEGEIEIPKPFSKKDTRDLIRAEELAKEFAIEIMGPDYLEDQKEEEEEPEQDEQEEEEEILEDEDITELKNDSPPKPGDFYKQYKIQEVIKRNQIVLVQVVKEERGNKGASLTTYLALAGRYCVFMPNTEKGGGVSRRITSYSERKRIRQVVKSMDVPKGTSVIVRTAGMDKEDDEIKSDFKYLKELWSGIRTQTLESQAPALVYEESDIIRRTIRDLYKGDVKEVVIEGEESYSSASKFVEAVSPEQAKNIKNHADKVPIFHKYKIEEKLDELFEPTVKLESGGSIVITPTEALVSVDVNSGKATKERSVEDTALKTNLEAARELVRQLRLRDLAGLIVVDFIDMRELKNRKAVEKELKDALKTDRAKIQVGRISTFGLLEMSRQRMHSSLLESVSECCSMCKGIGIVRSKKSLAMKAVRNVAVEAAKKTVKEIRIYASTEIAEEIRSGFLEEIDIIKERDEVKILIEEDYLMFPNQFEITTNRNKKRSLGKFANRIGKKSGKKSKKDSGNENKPDAKEEKSKPVKKSDDKKPSSSGKKKTKDKNGQANDNGSKNSDGLNTEDNEGIYNEDNSFEPIPVIDDGDEDKASKLLGLWKKITK